MSDGDYCPFVLCKSTTKNKRHCLSELYFITSLVVTPHGSNTWSVFVLQACLRATRVFLSPCPHYKLNAKYRHGKSGVFM